MSLLCMAQYTPVFQGSPERNVTITSYFLFMSSLPWRNE